MPQRAYRFRFYPNAIQRGMLARMFGTGRWVWNRCLSWRTTAYRQDGESLTGVDFSRELTFLKTLESYAWLREVPATIATQALRDQDRAFRAFFRGDAGYPRTKSRRGPQSVRLQLDQRVVAGNYRAGELLRLPGLGTCRLSWSRKPQGTPKMVTVRRDAAGRYWVSMAIEESIETLAPAPTSIGIDLGTTHLATLSTGERLENPRHLNRHAEQLQRLQQRLARQCKGSNRRAATQQRIARLHARIADCRREHLHRLTTRLIRDNQTICLEDLNTRGMSASARGTRACPGKRVRQKAGLNRSLLDAAFGEFARQLAYKAEWYGRTLVQVGRFYPSSKTCSGLWPPPGGTAPVGAPLALPGLWRRA